MGLKSPCRKLLQEPELAFKCPGLFAARGRFGGGHVGLGQFPVMLVLLAMCYSIWVGLWAAVRGRRL